MYADPRFAHTAVWTGTEMIVWGGHHLPDANIPYEYVYDDGARYDPVHNSWNTVFSAGIAARAAHTAIWTGSEMIVWGGNDLNSNAFGDGVRYYPAGNGGSGTWTTISSTGSPAARLFHSAVWTGSEMIVWGGFNGSDLPSGGHYDPSSNTWTAVSTSASPPARRLHTAIWTGSEMILWGGLRGQTYLSEMWSYTPPRIMYLYQRP